MNKEPGKHKTKIDKNKQALPSNNFEYILARGAELNEEIAISETQKLLKRLKDDDYPDYGDASVCIANARWRSDKILKVLEGEELKENAYVACCDMLSQLKGTRLINPYTEREAIRLYRGYWVISDKYRSRTLDVLLNKWLFEVELEKSQVQAYQLFRSKLTK